tara:strand:+ start:1017157 stop:1018101 length:945 start_codon:yes stop_codon:yes gene_type:complete
MTRAATLIAALSLVAIATTTIGGCASWRKSNEAIIHVQASQNPEKAERLTRAGITALSAGKIDLAEEKFLAAVDADLAYGPAHNNLGLMHYEQGNLYQAVLAFEHAMEYMPQDPTVLYNLGLTLESAGKVHEALDLYLQAVEMDPVNPNFLGNLVRLRVRMGDDDPSLVAQLQDLVLIETRPEWRSWADHHLAIRFNPILDRGPDTPEFNLDEDKDKPKRDRNVDNQIIDLSPGQDSSTQATLEQDMPELKPANPPADQSFQPPSDSPTLTAPQPVPAPTPQPMPIHDDASVEPLPPSIQLNPDDLPVEMDYFR